MPKRLPAEWTAALELRAIRAMLRLTQTEMAARLGCQPNTLALYERQDRPVPLPVLYLARAIVAHPQTNLLEQATLRTLGQRRREPARWKSVTFVLARVLPETAPCWHEPASAEVDLFSPCQGRRLQFVVLVRPEHAGQRARVETVTCEQHAYVALAALQEQSRRQLVRAIRKGRQSWGSRWQETLREYQDRAGTPGDPATKRPRGRPKKEVSHAP